ncbi:MAG: tryptophan--tRNA ligase [Thermogemmatispora sp.]|uniref:Tryptophan--tRNA ligase n=1 Tax=Thermogemmatispora tikiterensis TaxID=1825093 RepID=A0A328VSD1_9CHLR|nr:MULTISPECIES: tryptophan--tRNA ligase [Thermogemmatispora]MBX5458590.1 tryptophan--tRNA ligase [Thermogemmatispora sp.]RAQ98164.1 tryptophan--tRNA ligase [Thermogemmatispora tikiterensis]
MTTIGHDQQLQTSSSSAPPLKKRTFSGIQPSGDIHLGNYLGAIRNWVRTQTEYDNIYCIVDLHAITLPIDPQELRQNIRRLAAIYLACGLDTRYCKLFVQSHVRQHAEASWILGCFTPMGWLNRMTQFKAKAGENQETVGAGIYMYPVLMACDILLYQTHLVPVGEDQRQHLELTRDLAQRFNHLYKQEVFTIPEPLIREVGARIMSLTDPTQKMSKTNPNPNSRINLLDDPKTIKQKIARATTDSLRLIRFDPERPGINNLLTIYEALTERSREEIEAEFEGKGYGELKARLTEVVVATLEPIQRRYQEYMRDPAELEAILRAGADAVRPIAEATLQRMKDVIGLG